MKFEVPDELIAEQLSDQIISIVVKEIDKRLSLITKTNELPPYPNKSQVKRILVIGTDKLESWISEGLEVQIWSNKDHRIEREALQEFLRTHKTIN